MALNVLGIFMAMLSFPTQLCKAWQFALPINTCMYESLLLSYVLLSVIVSQKV